MLSNDYLLFSYDYDNNQLVVKKNSDSSEVFRGSFDDYNTTKDTDENLPDITLLDINSDGYIDLDYNQSNFNRFVIFNGHFDFLKDGDFYIRSDEYGVWINLNNGAEYFTYFDENKNFVITGYGYIVPFSVSSASYYLTDVNNKLDTLLNRVDIQVSTLADEIDITPVVDKIDEKLTSAIGDATLNGSAGAKFADGELVNVQGYEGQWEVKASVQTLTKDNLLTILYKVQKDSRVMFVPSPFLSKAV